MEELQRLERIRLKGREARVRDAALFALYTGLRFSDLNTLTSDHLVTERGKVWLVKQPLKTLRTSSATVQLPLYALFDGKAVALIEKYGKVERLAHVGNNAAANRTLKEVMRKIGIPDTRTVTFHTLRHSFVSLLIARGVPITTVQKLAGHAKVEMTLNYTHLSTKVIKTDVEKAFGRKKRRREISTDEVQDEMTNTQEYPRP